MWSLEFCAKVPLPQDGKTDRHLPDTRWYEPAWYKDATVTVKEVALFGHVMFELSILQGM
jgi:hypothetical protein